MIEQSYPILTIGHSTHTVEAFIALLRHNGVTAVADVRSKPFSRFNPHFSRPNLQQELKSRSIKYVFLGKELGARPDDPSCYVGGRVNYSRLEQTALFRDGLLRVMGGSREHSIALMCAEREPLECHRTILVARALARAGMTVQHILGDGRLEPHEATMTRLLHLADAGSDDLFISKEDLLVRALNWQEKRIAFFDEEMICKPMEHLS